MLRLTVCSLLFLYALCPLQPASADAYWYYCEPARQYYPYIHTCPVPWREVAATTLEPSGHSGSNTFQDQPSSQDQPQTPSATPSPASGNQVTTGTIIRGQSIREVFESYWHALGVGGVILAFGAFSILLGACFMYSAPAYSEYSPPGTRSVNARTYYYPARNPSRSQIRLGRKLVLYGFLLVVSGSCLSLGPTAFYHLVTEGTKRLL
jgi:hypothetical protein